jgi:hypothetical protein
LLSSFFLIQLNIITDVPEMQSQFVVHHGMLAILEVLEAKPSRDVILRLLRIINLVRFPLDFFSLTRQG